MDARLDIQASNLLKAPNATCEPPCSLSVPDCRGAVAHPAPPFVGAHPDRGESGKATHRRRDLCYLNVTFALTSCTVERVGRPNLGPHPGCAELCHFPEFRSDFEAETGDPESPGQALRRSLG
ncbi:hypothetical protein Pure04_15870 [Paenarthrobacter ureafaciens]|nr:hypothetical protein Pure03_14440 [Paenarthrobacter ureafaciens]GLU71872.1 hypothetical protein Pure04_15870 [Paenarthrobacter ureafaciens]